MSLMFILLVAAAVFGICFLIDKAFTKAFRSKAQHRSGLAVRANRLYGVFGVILILLGMLGILSALGSNGLLRVCSVFVMIVGICLAIHYLSFGIFYDSESFLVSAFGKKNREYAFREIRGQRLYLVQGGSVIIELHMTDGTAVSLQSAMDGVYPFLDTAFAGWCRQIGTDPQACSFHDPSISLWFPTMEEV